MGGWIKSEGRRVLWGTEGGVVLGGSAGAPLTGRGDDEGGLPMAVLAARTLIKCARKQVNSLLAHLVGERPAQG